MKLTSSEFRTRFIAAIAVGCIVTGLALVVAWNQSNHSSLYRGYSSQWTIEKLTERIELYRQRKGELPRTLEDLNSINDEDGSDMKWEELADPWLRPLIYTVEGDKYLVANLGRDGKPGGRGLDEDISNQHMPKFPQAHTFDQFLVEPATRRMIATCLIGGLLAAVIVLIPDRSKDAPARQPTWTKILVTALVALFVTIFISALHIPSGH